MKHINTIKLIFGLVLISIPIVGSINFFYHYLWNTEFTSSMKLYNYVWFVGRNGGASNTPLFFGLCAIAGAIILASIKSDSK